MMKIVIKFRMYFFIIYCKFDNNIIITANGILNHFEYDSNTFKLSQSEPKENNHLHSHSL